MNKNTKTSFTSDILTFVPKGSFYNTEDEQVQAIEQKWKDCLSEDRDLFSLATILPGSAYSKGRMNYYMLANPVDTSSSITKLDNLYLLEPTIIQHNLDNESIPRALKNCLMLANNRVNNRRTQKVILRYIFDRDIQDIVNLAIKYKQKLARLIRHALGKQNLYGILHHRDSSDSQLFNKHIGKYTTLEALNVLDFIFDHLDASKRSPIAKLAQYQDLREYAKSSDKEGFMHIADQKVLPIEVLMGFRNTYTYKLDIPIGDILETGKMSDRQKIQLQSTAKREDAEVEVDYNKQDIYDLWKLLYSQVFDSKQVTDDLVEAIDRKSKQKLDIDIGRTVVIMDASRSMEGSDKRFLHPFLTGLSLITVLPNVKEVIYVGGKLVGTSRDMNHRNHPLLPSVVVPSASTNLWEALLEAQTYDVDGIVVISDGYENSVKGAFEHVYKSITDKKVYHVNPVFASETASARRLASDLEPIVIDDYKQVKTNLIFRLLQTDKALAKSMLVSILAQSKSLSASERRLLP